MKRIIHYKFIAPNETVTTPPTLKFRNFYDGAVVKYNQLLSRTSGLLSRQSAVSLSKFSKEGFDHVDGQTWRRRQYVPLKHWHPPKSSHFVTNQKVTAITTNLNSLWQNYVGTTLRLTQVSESKNRLENVSFSVTWPHSDQCDIAERTFRKLFPAIFISMVEIL
jgi:hypothetical protein